MGTLDYETEIEKGSLNETEAEAVARHFRDVEGTTDVRTVIGRGGRYVAFRWKTPDGFVIDAEVHEIPEWVAALVNE